MNRQDKNDSVELIVYVDRKSKAAMLCIRVEDLQDDNPHEFWLPYLQIEILSIDHKKDHYTIRVPHWLALEKELI
jgi:hypothetical protein